MNINNIMELYNNYKQIALAIDLCTIGINICVLIVLLSHNKNLNLKMKRSFILHIFVTLTMILCEMISWVSLFNKDYLFLYKFTVILDYFLMWIVPITMINLMISIIEYKTTFNKKIIYILYSVFLIFGSLLIIPAFRKLIIVFNDELVLYKYGVFNLYYFLIETNLILVGFIAGLRKAKEIGIKDMIVLSLFMLSPLVAIYVNEWWSSTVGMLLISFCLVILIGITYQKRLIDSREKEKERQIGLADAKMRLLLTQIQPHFLYNTLTTLKFLCETDPNKASELCDDFSGYLRANIDAVNDAGLVPFEKELENIKNYLKIEKARFGSRVNYKFDIEFSNFMIPVLSIQTIVENAVKKGICSKINGGTITITTREINDMVEIKVIDDGIGFDMNTYMFDGKNHTGLSNTKERLKMIDGNVKVESEINKGTIVTVLVKKGD